MTEDNKKDDDEISIDFSKIKNIFKRKDKKTEPSSVEKKDDGEEIDVDIKQSAKSIWNFILKYQVIFLILIPLLISIVFRMYPVYLPATDVWATNSVDNYYKNQIASQINSQYPNLPDANKQVLIDTKFNEILKTNKAQIAEQIKQTSAQFKSRMTYTGADGKEHTYITDIDSYYWLMFADWFIKNGHWGTDLKDGLSWDYIHNGREGRPGVIQFQPLAIVIVYKVMSIFNGNLPVMDAALILPAIIVALSIFPAFFIGRKIAGNLGGIVSAMVVAVIPASIARTMSADTDSLNILFPLLIMWTLVEALEAKNTKKKVIFASLTGFITGIYAFAWSGWAYTAIIILAYVILDSIFKITYNFIVHKKLNIHLLKDNLIIGGTYFVSTSIFTFLFSDYSLINQLIFIPQFVVNMKDVAAIQLWPNVLTTVAEFNVTPVNAIVSQMGGDLLFWIGLIGITFLLVNRKKMDMKNMLYLAFAGIYYAIIISLKESFDDPIILMIALGFPVAIGILKIIYFKEENIDINLALILILWFMSVTYGFTRGVRFSVLMVAAFAIALGIGMGFMYRFVIDWVIKELKINKMGASIILILIFGMMFVMPTLSARDSAKSQVPYVDDAWYDTLIGIKNNSTDAIITSWWDFGHWFTEIAQRRVTFDGANQGERIYWVGKSLLTSDEDVAMGILRMLNCGHESAPHILEKYMDNDTVKSIDILNKIIVVDKNNASKILKENGLDDSAIQEVLNATHCSDLIPSYYITSEDMVGKAGVWAHFGSWDFKRAEMYNKVKQLSQNEGVALLTTKYNLSQEEADKIYYEIQTINADQWISPWPSYMGGPYPAQVKDNIVTCSNGVKVNLKNYSAEIPTQKGIIDADSIVYATKDDLVEKKSGQTNGVSIALIPSGKSYNCLLMDPLLAKSMFTRLFFFDGQGSQHFKLFSDKTTISGDRITVWTINWNPGPKNIMEAMQEKTIAKTGNEITVDYIGWTNEGVFDSSIVDWRNKNITNSSSFDKYSSNELNFVLGSGQVIPGFDNGILGMKINTTKTIEIPPEQAYGLDPTKHPLGNKTLFFKVRLTAIS